MTFRPVAAADTAMLADWIARPHWQEWWGEPEAEIAMILAMIEGRDPTRPFIFEIGARPTGYIQYWPIGASRSDGSLARYPWLAELPANAVGVDISIADEAMLSRGIGSAVLAEFAGALTRQDYRTIVIDPDPANRRAVRAYEKAGFRTIERLRGHTKGVQLMAYEADRQTP